MKIAMWSGPRNLSTAMMYSFGNRSDCQISDEPFYAAYLKATGLDHPMREQVMQSQPQDPNTVIESVTSKNTHAIWYQKHMTHHMLPDFDFGWLETVKNVFLIRDPARVIASYEKKYDKIALLDLGFAQQLNIFDHCQAQGIPTVVIDADDILADPKGMLTALCGAIGIPLDLSMLKWTAGPRSEDGVWASHWYDSVHKSTGFGSPKTGVPQVPKRHADILQEATKIYQALRQSAIGPAY